MSLARRLLFALLPLAVLGPAPAGGQTAGVPAVQAFGSFRQLRHTGDAGPRIALREVQGAGTYGVGALAGLRGEVVIWDGKVAVTRGHSAQGRAEPAGADDAATMLAVARVSGWHEIAVPGDMTQAEFERFVVEQASARGIPVAAPFPFLVRGEFPALTWHVITGAAAGAHGAAHAQGHASNRVFDEPNSAGQLVGFYSGAALEGVISHPGERFHVHYADRGFVRSGHVDGYAVRAGAVLSLPR